MSRTGPIRVLVVDDSAVFRLAISTVLNDDPGIEVVGTAADGRMALEKVASLRPDLVTLDVEMPELDGLAVLSQLRATTTRLPVVMFSSLTERAAAVTVMALSRGAADYVTKPSGQTNLASAMASVRRELIPKVHALCPLAPVRAGAEPSPVPTVPTVAAVAARPAAASGPVPLRGGSVPAGTAAARSHVRPAIAVRPAVVAIGVSTGGPAALGVLLSDLVGLAVPTVIVQHMPPMFTHLLAEQLSRSTRLKVVEGTAGMPLRPGCVYIAPGDHHMVVERYGVEVRLGLNEDPPESSCRPAVDVLFRSVAKVYGSRALAVVLTGMGSDGERGSQEIRAAGGSILAQDQESAVVWGMPGAVVRAGLCERVLPIGELGRAIRARAAGPGHAALPPAPPGPPVSFPPGRDPR